MQAMLCHFNLLTAYCVCAMTVTNKYLSVYCPLSQKYFSLGQHFWLLHKTQWKLKSIEHISFFLLARAQSKNYTKHSNKKHLGHTFSPPLESGNPLHNSQRGFKSHPASSLRFQLPFIKLGQTKGSRIRQFEKNLICVDLLVSESAVTVSNCQYYSVLAVVLQRRKHMQAQLVEACLLNSTPSYTDFLVWRSSQPEERHAGRERLPEVAFG